MRRAIVVLALLPIVLAACGGGSGSKSGAPAQNLSPTASVRAAAQKTAQATSERMTMTATVGVRGQSVVVSGGGVFANPSRTGSLHLDFNAGGLAGSIDEIVKGTTVYMKSPFFSSVLPKGKTWLKLDLQKTLATQGIDFSALTSQEPTQMLGRLQAVKGMTKIGDETIDGVDTTHYRGRIDVTKIPQAAKIQALTNARYGPYDVWIGKDDGYVHRLKLAYSYGPSATARQSITLTMDLSDFGKDVSVTPPPASETFDATKASLKGLGG